MKFEFFGGQAAKFQSTPSFNSQTIKCFHDDFTHLTGTAIKETVWHVK